MNYRSVAGDGIITFVTEPAEKRHGLDLLMEHHSGRRDFDYHDHVFAVTEVLRLTVTTCTGKERK
jgi:nitroimidazol reductase NimA-like FMN-containing flavoprotein (pyridoxamine 5'-phosphate oxidase superfamily)